MTKLTDTQKQVEALKRQVERFLGADDDALLGMLEEYLEFKSLLSALLSPIARYRLQLSGQGGVAVVFGPKTRKTVEELVRHYDKVFEIDEEILAPRFNEVESVKEILAKQSAEDGAEEPENWEISIAEETKQDLARMEREKQRPRNGQAIQANLDNIMNEDIVLSDPFYCVQQVYRNDPAVSLREILIGLSQDCPGPLFLEVVQKLGNLLAHIAQRPDEVTQRILRISHEKLYEDLIQYPRAVALLKYTGFKVKHSDDLQQELKQLGMTGLSNEHFLYLREPDMFNEYGSWKRWLDFVNGTSALVAEFVAQYRLRMRNAQEATEELVISAFESAEDSVPTLER